MIDGVVLAVKDELGSYWTERVAKTGFLAGDSFTLADINVLPILAYLRNFSGIRRGHRCGEVAFGLF